MPGSTSVTATGLASARRSLPMPTARGPIGHSRGMAAAGDEIATLVGAVIDALEQRRPTPETLRRAASAATTLATAATELPPSRAELMYQAGDLLLRCYDRTGARADLVTARNRLVAAADADPDDPARPAILAGLGRAWRATYRLTDDPADLDRAVTAGRAAVAAAPPDAPPDPAATTGLAVALRELHRIRGDAALLAESIALDEENLRHLAAGDPDRSVVLHELANALDVRFERDVDPDDLRRMVAAREEVYAASDADEPDHAYVVGGLATAYARRWTAFGDPTDLDRAVALAGEAIDAGGPDAIGRARLLRERASHLRLRYAARNLAHGRADDVEWAVEDCRVAIELCPPGGGEWLAGVDALAACLQARYAVEADLADLESLVTTGEQVVEHTPDTAPEAGVRAMHLGNALRARFVRSREPADLERAIAAYERSAALPHMTAADRVILLVNLGAALLDRYDLLRAEADLTRATNCSATAARHADPGTATWRQARHTVGRALSAQAAGTGVPAVLRQAREAFDDVVRQAPPGSPEQLQARLDLAGTRVREWRTHDGSAVRRAAVHREAVAGLAALTQAAAAVEQGIALAAARTWGDLTAAVGDWAQAADAYRAASTCLESIHRRQVRRDLKVVWLLDGEGVTAAAVYALARVGDLTGSAVAAE
jgi:hypothetical protein